MNVVLVTIGIIILLVCVAVVLLLVRAISGSYRVQAKIEEGVHQIVMDIKHGGIFEDDLLSLAKRLDIRSCLFRRLHEEGQIDLFPEQFKNIECIAESDLVEWLLHPNELNAIPEEIELVKTYEKKNDSGSILQFFIFKFRTVEPHWASKKGWIAGIAGPYILGEEPLQSPPCVFSCFEGFETRTPEEHCKITMEAVFKRIGK